MHHGGSRAIGLSLAVALILGLGGAGCSCGGSKAQQDAAPPQQDAAPQQDAQEDAFVPPDGFVPDGFQQPDGFVPDGGTGVFITEVVPAAVSRTQDNDVQIVGGGLEDGATVTLTNCDTGDEYTFTATVADVSDGGVGGVATITIPADVTRVQGIYTVTIANPDGSWATLDCALSITAAAPPTVTNVTPASASTGDPTDGISSDQPVTITGTGFQSTPNVRWQEVATGTFYNASIVGFVSDTQLTAVCPSESRHMPAGDYYVWVVNPDNLAGEWLVGGTTVGIFKVLPAPPPRIDAITPQSFPGTACATTDLTVTGSGFVTGAGGTQFYLVEPAPNGCTGGLYDPQGNWLCPVTGTASSATSATIRLTPNCPQNGGYPIEAINPDGQAGIYYFIVLTPSSTCHLQGSDSWTPVQNGLQTARYLFASATGCDEFGHSFIYAAGGIDGSTPNAAIDSVEFSEVTLLGVPGPWHPALQYLDASNPRVTNTLGGLSTPAPREGLTLVRVGRHLYAIGGAAQNSNVNPGTTAVAALDTTEHAFILGYETIPMSHVPKVTGTGGLPTGSWYYRVSAIGAFGEGLASDEVVLPNEGGTLKVCWTVPQLPATAYNIYRTVASDGRSRSEILLAAGVPGDDSGINGIKCFTDNGLADLTPAPGRLRGVVTTNGTLAVGTYRYRVSATIDNGTLAPFETKGGYEAAVQLTATGAIELHWDPVPYAAAYNLYKWNGTAQKFVLYASTADGTTLKLTDDGTTPTATCPLARTDTPCAPLEGIAPLPPGSLSTWETSAVKLATAREGLDGVPIVYQDDNDATKKRYFLVVAGGRSSNALGSGAFLSSVESVEVDPTDGHLIDPGSGFWAVETETMNSPRAFFPLVTNQGRQDPTFCPPAAQPPCQDRDGDGYYDCACASQDQMPCDCDDTNPDVHPGQTETGKCTNGIDDDCDGYTDCADSDCSADPNCNTTCTTDADGDGYVALVCGGNDCCDSGTEGTDFASGHGTLGCDPTTASGIHPGAVEICGDGIDQNCDGVDEPCACDTDADGDGHISVACGGDDCCDSGTEGNDFFSGHGTLGCNSTNAASIHPGAFDVCGDGIDQNCDGWDALCSVYQPTRVRPDHGLPPEGPMSLAPAGLVPARFAPLPRAPRWPQGPTALPKLYGSDARVWLVAAQGLDALQTTMDNAARSDLEACELAQTNAPAAGALLVACGPVTNQWATQVSGAQQTHWGHEVMLYGQNPTTADPSVSCLYTFSGVQSQTLGSAPSPRQNTQPRFPVYTGLNDTGHANDPTYLLGASNEKQGGAPAPSTSRAYYQMVRLNGYLYVIGGHTGTAPTPIVERIQQ